MVKHLGSVAEAQQRARRRLPKAVYTAIMAGVEQGLTREANVSAFDDLGFIPRVGSLGGVHDQRTTVMGQDLSFPVITSSVGAQALHSSGELGVARATKKAGTAIALSNFSTQPVADVIAGNDKLFFQVYWVGTKSDIAARVEAARAAGAKGLIATLDLVSDPRADWPRPSVPDRIDLRTLLQYAPQGITHARWTADFLLHGGLPRLTAPNMFDQDNPNPTFADALIGLATATSKTPPSWDDIAWLRELWGGPFMVKGVMHPDDARRAVDIGATAISVSNHGGNNLDSTPATIRVLPAVADAVGDQIEILLDGGIRRGSDVVKALALGARAVMIGRAYLFGLAAKGEQGVTDVLEMLRAGIRETLLGLRKPSIHDLTPHDIVIPEGFIIRDFSAAPTTTPAS
jgi:pre-mycofactocin synthase